MFWDGFYKYVAALQLGIAPLAKVDRSPAVKDSSGPSRLASFVVGISWPPFVRLAPNPAVELWVVSPKSGDIGAQCSGGTGSWQCPHAIKLHWQPGRGIIGSTHQPRGDVRAGPVGRRDVRPVGATADGGCWPELSRTG